jgi:ATP-binding cassette subfamily C protein CydC
MTGSTGSPRPLRQLWRWLRLERWLTARLALAALLGVGAAASATGLLLTSAWLISRAAQHPPVLYLMVAIVAVRAFGIARGVLRYVERLVAHDAAFRLLTTVRVAVYRRVEPLGPAGLADHRRGDVVRRLVGDVDAVQDLLLRAVLPLVVTVAVSSGVTFLVVAVLPAAGVVLAITVLGVLVLVPTLVRATGRTAERSIAPRTAGWPPRYPSLLCRRLTSSSTVPPVPRSTGCARSPRHYAKRSGVRPGVRAWARPSSCC